MLDMIDHFSISSIDAEDKITLHTMADIYFITCRIWPCIIHCRWFTYCFIYPYIIIVDINPGIGTAEQGHGTHAGIVGDLIDVQVWQAAIHVMKVLIKGVPTCNSLIRRKRFITKTNKYICIKR